MPNDETKKTKSEPSASKHRWLVRAFIVLAAIVGIAVFYWKVNSDSQVISLHRHEYHVQIASTESEREQGLSGTQPLSADQAMLFIFPDAATWGIWMKDMNYPIDVVWLNDAKQVVYMVKDFQPSTYSSADPSIKTRRSSTPARYVIELPSGTIEKTGIVLGDPAGFPSGI